MDPNKTGCNIGVVLYQQSFYISRGNGERSSKLLGKQPYPSGGVTVGWSTVGDLVEAYPLLVFRFVIAK